MSDHGLCWLYFMHLNTLFCFGNRLWVLVRCREMILLARNAKERLELTRLFSFVFQNKVLQKENAELKKKLTRQTN